MVAKYIRAEQLHIRANDRWTKPACDGETGWASSPLASVVTTATPEAIVRRFETSGPALATALEIRANYRVCGALFMVGNGARSDALSLIDGARCTYPLWPFLLCTVMSRIWRHNPELLPGEHVERLNTACRTTKADT